MAKRKYIGKTSSGSGRGKGAQGKTVVKFVAVLLALLAAAYVITSLVFGVWNPLKWGKPATPDKDRGQDNVIITDGDNNGFQLLSAALPLSEYAAYGLNEEETETAYTLTLSVTPAEAVVTDFTWSAEFVNPQSEWANGKDVSDYMTITPADNNRSAAVACKQAFGEQIRVKCVYDGDSKIFATKLADYVKKIVGYTFITSGVDISNDDSGETSVGNDLRDIIYSVGTVQGNYEIISGWYELSDEAYEYLMSAESAAHGYMSQFLAANPGIELYKTSNVQANDNDGYDWFESVFPREFTHLKWNEVKEQQYLNAAFKTMIQNVETPFRWVLSATYSYNTYSETLIFNSDWAKVYDNIVLVTGVGFNGDSGNLYY